MDEHALRVLEFDAIRRQLMEQAACSLGRERAESMTPGDFYPYVRARLDETTECRKLIGDRGNLPLGGVTDIRPWIRQAEIGGTLDPRALLDVYSTANAGRSLKTFLQKIATDYPIMAEKAGGLGQFASLESEITSCIGSNGQVLDAASPDLARIRSRKKVAASRMMEKLNSIVSGPMRTLLQDPVIVQRGDRYCVPVKAEHRGAFGGIVHDTSASGATLFMEPQAVVDLGNELKELAIREDQEIARILARLTDSVRRVSTPLNVTVEVLGEIDFIASRAKLAETHNAVEPDLSQSGRTRLVAARHPLIDPDVVVAIDVEIGAEQNQVLLITGPNTGGKTVTLKTVGLLTLMAQCGLHVPAAHADMNVFYQIYADIGDEQSLQQSLSTFSGHISNIVKIVGGLPKGPRPQTYPQPLPKGKGEEKTYPQPLPEGRGAGERAQRGCNSLVLLDEVGAGTDPGEGASLARSILDHLRTAGARVIATTHYGELKTYAFVTDGVQNASVEFDQATLAPTYRLLQGIPGSSNAFAIATRLGMSPEIIDAARLDLTGSDATSELMTELEAGRRQALSDAREAERARIEAQMLKRRYQDELSNLQALRREARQKAAEDARALIKRAQERVDSAIAEVRRASSEGRETERARTAIQSIGADLQRAIERQTEPEEEPIFESVLDRLLRRGDRVRLVNLGMIGEVLEDQTEPGSAALPIQVGAMRVSVPPSDLRLLSDPSEAAAVVQRAITSSSRPKLTEATSETGGNVAIARAAAVSQEVNLLGRRAEEAIQIVEKFLEDTYTAGLTRVRIVHGKGTGALRRAIQDYLQGHGLVSSFETAHVDEGGAGVTIVTLKET